MPRVKGKYLNVYYDMPRKREEHIKFDGSLTLTTNHLMSLFLCRRGLNHMPVCNTGTNREGIKTREIY